jgi:hypothetical protein
MSSHNNFLCRTVIALCRYCGTMFPMAPELQYLFHCPECGFGEVFAGEWVEYVEVETVSFKDK